MKIKELAIQELMKLDTDDMVPIYDLIKFLRVKKQKRDGEHGKSCYMKVRYALKTCHGSLSHDIIVERSERV